MRHLEPPDTVDHVECVAEPSAARAQCGKCGTTIAGGSIVDAMPEPDDAGQMGMLRTIFCPHCSHLQTWVEACNAAGRPIGMILTGPCFYRGQRVVARFLTRHPEAAGVLQR